MSFLKRTFAEKLVPLDDEEIKHRIELDRTYRDRAEERRQQQDEDQNAEVAVVEGEAMPIKLRGLDFDLLQKEQEEIEKKNQERLRREAEMEKLRQLRNQLPKPPPKKVQSTLALKIMNIFNQPTQTKVVKNIQTFYIFDMHPAFPRALPEFVTKKFEEIESQNQYIQTSFPGKLIEEIQTVQTLTEGLTKVRTNLFRPVVLDKAVDCSDSDNIFDDVADVESQKMENIEPEQIEEELFDPQEYLRSLKAEEDMLNEAYNEKYKEQLENQERINKEKAMRHQKMLQEEEDHYMECYQPINTEIDVAELPDKPRGKKGAAGKFKGGKPKKKKENFDKQYEQIEQIMKKQKQ